MKILVFDTETTGLPERRGGRYPLINDINKWPYIVQLSYILYDLELKKMLECQDHIIKLPSNVIISKESTNIHGINRTLCNRKGICINYALEDFNSALNQADYIIAHNLSFDKRMIQVENIRLNNKDNFIHKYEYCTMKNNVDFCAIERIGRNGDKYFKYPTLGELYEKMFHIIPKGTHDSMVDVLICLRCYYNTKFEKDIIKDSCKVLKNIYKLYNI